MVISCLYWLFRHLLGLIVLRCRSEAANEVEILVCGTSWRCCAGRLDGQTAGRLIGHLSRRLLGCLWVPETRIGVIDDRVGRG